MTFTYDILTLRMTSSPDDQVMLKMSLLYSPFSETPYFDSDIVSIALLEGILYKNSS